MFNARIFKKPLLAVAVAVMLLARSATCQDGVTVPKRQQPGRLETGAILLPNGWKLSAAGKTLPLGDLPLNMSLTADGRYLAVIHSGQGENSVAIIDIQAERAISQVTIPKAWYGLAFSHDNKVLYAGGAGDNVIYSYDFARGFLSNERKIVLGDAGAKIYPAGLAVSRDGARLYAVNNLGHSLSAIDARNGTVLKTIPLEADSYPYACVLGADSNTVYVSLWGKSAVAVVDVKSGRVTGRIATDDHPNALLLSPDGEQLFVANANSNTVSVIDVRSRKRTETISTALYPNALEGSTPNALAVSKDGKTLLVANADNNNLAVVDLSRPGSSAVRGFIPTGWYPTGVEFSADQKKIYVANGKGRTSLANPQGPRPFNTPITNQSETQYIGRLLPGTLSIIDVPDAKKLDAYTAQVYANSPYLKDHAITAQPAGANPIPARLGDPSPIKYVIYIIKENRTYDQVLGDLPEGNGDPYLCLFPERITPNHHGLAREFVLFDNFYADAEVSADGHNWSMGAYATDYVEKLWPQTYSQRNRPYDFDPGQAAIALPSIGYIWDQANRAGLSYRSYGEGIRNGKTPADPGKPNAEALEGHFDPYYRGYDLDYRDLDRAKRFIQELKGFEEKGELPRLTIMHLPNDHTAATRPGALTPTAMLGDNDLALGKIVEAISHSRFWKETAIFVVEDDAQSGPDHVDAHRTIAFVASPYAKRRFVDGSMYSTTSILRTVELILGIPPMSQFDAAARPMYNAFTMSADFTPYTARPVSVDLEQRNSQTAWGAQESLRMNLAKEDAAPELALNEIIWKSVKGADSEMPPPVRAAFVHPHQKGDD